MWKLEQMENVTKGIIRDIKEACASKGVNVEEGLASYVIKFTVLNPKNNFAQDKPLKPDDLQKLVNICAQKLCEENSPSTACLRMQVEFVEKHRTRQEIIAENRNNFKQRSSALVRDIINTVALSKEDMEDLYHKLVVVLILKSGLGNPHQSPVLKEATAALTSVFPETELGPFLALPRREKEIQIHELTNIVTGIRLFNHDCKKGGEGIEDLPSILEQTVVATKKSIDSFLHKLMHNIDSLTTSLEIYLEKRMMRWGISAEAHSAAIEEEDVDPEEVEFMKETLIASRQLEIYMRKICAELEVSHKELADALGHLKTRLSNIHKTVRFRTAIPTTQVYPQFVDLAEVWGRLQDEMIILRSINSMIWDLHSYMQVFDQIDRDIIKSMLNDKPVLSDENRLNATPDLEIVEMLEQQTDMVKPTATNFSDIEPQCLGFCPWALVAGDGLLIPGNLRIGLFPWNGQYYSVSSAEAGLYFVKYADRITEGVLDLVKRLPQLSELLQIPVHLDHKEPDITIPTMSRIAVLKEDKAIQTEVHPLQHYKDPNYIWNVWEYKRRAIQLANILNYKTHSTQTERSNFRSSKAVQAGCPKTVACQTKRENASYVPTSGTFIYGLCGRTDKKFIIHLTTPPDEKECIF